MKRIFSPVMLAGTMMDVPLTVTGIFERTVRSHANREVVWREGDAGVVRYTYGDFGRRVAQLAHALTEFGVLPGDRVASFAWNTQRHLELYYAVPMIGAVLHTLNVRLFPGQIRCLLEHAEDTVVFVDAALVSVLAKALVGQPPCDRRYIVMGPAPAELPDAFQAATLYDYERLLWEKPTTFPWPELDERSAALLCYTSGTTGAPKGVAFSHRSTVLHALSAALGDALDVRERDVVMPLVPMFHANAWGVPFIAPLVGAKLVLPGASLDALTAIDLVERESVSVSLGVPTVWLAIRDELHARGKRLPTLDRVHIGGSAMPPRLFDDLEALGITVLHGWGMTEMSPIGAISHAYSGLAQASPQAKRAARLKQGRALAFVAWKLLDDDGNELARDGQSKGQLWVRGHTVSGRYYREDGHAGFSDGWFATGDICTLDEHGYLQIVDRLKDMVKSGGEWISSVELENALLDHPSVKEAAVVGVAHPTWIERPLACVVIAQGATVDEQTLQNWLAERVAKWQVPDRVIFLDALPRTGVGKLFKRQLRERFRDVLQTSMRPR